MKYIFAFFALAFCSCDKRSTDDPARRAVVAESAQPKPLAPVAPQIPPPDLAAVVSILDARKPDAERLLGKLTTAYTKGACRSTCPKDQWFRCKSETLAGRWQDYDVEVQLRDGRVAGVELRGVAPWMTSTAPVMRAFGVTETPTSCAGGSLKECWEWRECRGGSAFKVGDKPFDLTAIPTPDGAIFVLKDWTTIPAKAKRLSFDEAMEIPEKHFDSP